MVLNTSNVVIKQVVLASQLQANIWICVKKLILTVTAEPMFFLFKKNL